MNLKGQGMIIEIIIFGVVIFLSLAMFFLLTVSDSVEEENVEATLDGRLGGISGEAAMTYILKQRIDREIESGNQYNTTFEKIAQAYFSTDGDIRINGKDFDRDQVREDMEAFLEYGYPGSTQNIGTTINYPGTRAVFNISQGDEYISYRNGQSIHDREWNRHTRKIPTSTGNAEVELWIKR